jgi:serine protease Do
MKKPESSQEETYMYRSVNMIVSALACFIMLVCSISPVGAAGSGALQQLGEAFVEVAEKVTPAVVHINSTRKVSKGNGQQPFSEDNPLKEFFGDEFFKRFQPSPQDPGQKVQGMGSGIIVSADGKVVTNAHVVEDAAEITVTLADKQSFKAKVIGADKQSDIAVIKIDGKNLPTATFGDSDKLRVGEIVLAIGNPFGLSRTVTSGIVSAKGRTNMGILDYEDFLQTDAAINPGNSGGPLVNIYGEVVGINTAIASRSGGYQGIGFAIPSNSARLIEEQIVKEGTVHRGLLGVNIQNLDESLAKSFGLTKTEGALVSQVEKGSAASKGGVKSGDVIVEFDGKPIQDASRLKNLVATVRPGTTCKLTVIRDGKTEKLTVTVGEKDAKKVASAKGSEPTETSSELGIEVGEVPPSIAQRLRLKENHGVVVSKVSPDGIGGKMGLQPADIILEVDSKEVSSISDFNSAVAKAKANKVVRLKVQRKNQPPLFMGYSLG